MAKEILKTGNWFVDQLSLYQSANSDNKSVRKNFVIRQAEFELIISDLKNKKPADPLQHELVLGRRGSGKSTLLKRIQVEIEEDEVLKEKYIAINLAEEQAGIYRLFDLWEEVCKELANKYKLDKTLKPYSDFEDDTAFTRYLYAQVHEVLTKEKKKVVLLLDNFDRITGNFADDGHLLRETLLNYNNIQLVAGSTRMDEHFWQYDKPFYEFFRRHRLEALDIKEIVQLLNHWATVMELPQLAEFAKRNIGKLEAIRILTDGLPRTLQFFIQLLLQNDTLHGYDYLRKIMDSVTPLYQERLNNLPAAQRKIVAEMAFIWEACAVKELVDKCRMESKLISAQIKQLTNLGIVDTIGTSKKNHLYRLSERFFNMWLMITQGNPEQKRKAKWLSIFLESWYDADELQALAGEHIGKLRADKLGYDKALVMAKAFTQSKYITTGQRDEILDLTNRLNEDQAAYGMLELPRKVHDIITEIDQLEDQQEYDRALELVDEIENEADGYKFYLKGNLYGLKKNFVGAEKYYLQAIGKGHESAIFNLALQYHNQKNYTEAEKYYLLAIEKGGVDAMNNLAVMYQDKGYHQGAKKFYMQAINKGNISSLYNLALLHKIERNYTDAEKCYLKAIEMGHENAIFNLAILYMDEGKNTEAKKYYLQAIENGDTDAMNNLAVLFQKQNNNKEAEEYYLKAIAKGNAEAMYNLARLYESRGKEAEAEKYYLQAIEKKHMGAMNNLAFLYESQGNIIEAEKYYLLAVELEHTLSMINLALLYFKQNKNKEVALQYIRKAGMIEPALQIQGFQIIIEVLNGILDDLGRKLSQAITDVSYEGIEYLLIGLLDLEQTNLIHQLFTHPIHGPELQKRYQPLYFAVLQLSGNMEPDAQLRIPPEILPTVEDIVKEVKEKQRFYAAG